MFTFGARKYGVEGQLIVVSLVLLVIGWVHSLKNGDQDVARLSHS